MRAPDLDRVDIKPIGSVRRTSVDENERDRSLVARIELYPQLAPALDGIDGFSHLYVIYWMHQLEQGEEPVLHHPGPSGGDGPVGILATRAPIHPNPLGLCLVELLRREGPTLWVRGLDALDGSPVLDLKPYPDWERGRFLVVTDFRVPGWLAKIAH
jgi:tRNA-Thr(GGU) m(6)t(6)A37 methyltransferase TsaA